MPDPPQSLGAARYYGPTLPTIATPLTPAVSPCDKRTRPIVAAVIPPGIDGSQWDQTFTTALTNAFIIATIRTTVRSIACRIDASAPSGNVFLLLWDRDDIPPDGTLVELPPVGLMAPVKVQHVSGVDDNLTLDFDEGGALGTTGLVLCLSTTEFVQTLGPGLFLSASASIASPVP